ncbi:hypothetical protein [Streptomyces sp. TRM68367]|uniref:hypothetical protein n=1 Tax=Streptomyces sp. TRM68367 TaxID=2758415 RepID=UPI00165ADF2F|nr:hypothetical protein [Streptomyces sp. TRM68367]MBC9730758.1 hypothetical protein [Streptomyces sp. TRM68367]
MPQPVTRHSAPARPARDGAKRLPFRPADVIRHLLRPDRVRRWAPVAPALFHLALVHTHGRSAVERAETHAVRRLGHG